MSTDPGMTDGILQPLPGPLNVRPDIDRPTSSIMLREALAGIELGAYDRDVLSCLRGQHPDLVAALASLLRRARVRGFSEAAEVLERERGEL